MSTGSPPLPLGWVEAELHNAWGVTFSALYALRNEEKWRARIGTGWDEDEQEERKTRGESAIQPPRRLVRPSEGTIARLRGCSEDV